MLKYHSRTFDLIGTSPRQSPEAAREIDALEKRIGRQLPASLREWYSFENACELLAQYSNQDPPVPINKLGTDGLAARDLLVFKDENQGVCSWAVILDGTDDPPVVVDNDTDFKKHRPCVDAFSKHIYSCVWDWGLALNCENLVQAQNQALTDKALSTLRSCFNAELQTQGWPADTQYRFHRGDQRILLWCGESQVDWWLSAKSEASLLELVRKVWSIDQVGESLWAHTDAGTMVLREARDGGIER